MTIHKPSYYDSFKCIAGECSFTCCQEWKIAVDKGTKEKWEKMDIPYEACMRNNSFEKLDASAKLDSIVCKVNEAFEENDINNDYVIRLREDGFCPMLNKCGLCDIVLEYGENNISNTCHNFPREEHQFGDFKELSLAAGCPAVIDLLCKEQEFIYISSDSDVEKYDRLIIVRDNILKIFRNCSNIEKAFKMSYFILLDLLEAEEVSESADKESVIVFDKSFLEQLSDKMDEIDGNYCDTVFEQNELFLDICDSYRKKQIYKDVIEELAIIAEAYEDELSEKLQEDRSNFDQYYKNVLDKYWGLVMQEEIYSTLYLPEGDLYSMTLKMQWLGITYAVIRHSCFLFWKKYGHIEYDDIRQIIVVLIRMTGYSESDIEEYLENSFEEIIWDWGYMALIIGE